MFYISILISKITHFLITSLKLGAGYTWPGCILLKFNKNFLQSKQLFFPKGIVLITGTNGKTTTTKLISHLLSHKGLKVLHNTTGANVKHGIVSTLSLNTNIFGKLNYDVAVLEVDELTLPEIVNSLHVNIIGFLNLSRDQLDRHWEIDIVFNKWRELKIDNIKIFLPKDDPRLDLLTTSNTVFFDETSRYRDYTSLLGGFNSKNINCAVEISKQYSLSEDEIVAALKTFKEAFGRGEKVVYKGKSFHVFLAKNPASLNENLTMLAESDINFDSLLYVLNDNVPDGLDVSWIYDVDPKLLENVSKNKKVFVSGTRAMDMGIRLQYAGVKVVNIHSNLEKMVIGDFENMVVLPNYSAMLEVRKVLTGKKIL